MKSFLFSSPRYGVEVFYEETPSSCRVTKIRINKEAGSPTDISQKPDIPKKPKQADMISAFLQAYFEQKPLAWDFGLLVVEKLSPFQVEVLRLCAAIPYGRVAAYKDLANALGKPQAARAIGQVMALNPFPILVPCHRIVKSDGKIGNYAYGASEKMWLLEHEGIVVAENGFVRRDFFIGVSF